MATAGTNVFAGLRPRIAPHLLDDMLATACRNARLVDGLLRPLEATQTAGAFPVAPLTIWKWEDADYWLTFTERVRIARSINAAIDRLYYTGDGAPRVGNVSDAPGVGMFEAPAPYPNNTFLLGVPKPGSAPSWVVDVAQPDENRDYTLLDMETRYYVFTMVNDWDEESAASPASMAVECYDDSWLTITVSPPANGGYVPFKAIRLYRTNTGTDTTDFQFVAEAVYAGGDTAIVDQRTSAELAEVAETLLWEVPPADLQYLTLVGDRFYAGASGRELCFSEDVVPYAWPLAYRSAVEDPIVGVASNGADVVVLTRGRPMIFTGNSASAMQPIRIAEYQPCMSETSVTVADGMVVYASPDGLIGISSAQGFRNLTEAILTREQWLALDPGTMHVTPWERLLLVKSAAGAFLFDIAGQSYTPIDLEFDAAFYDGYTDTLHLANGTQHLTFATGAPGRYEWQGKANLLPGTDFTSARVHALSYADLYFELYVDNRRVLRTRVHDAEGFRLPAVRGRSVVIRLEGGDTVRSVSIATSMGELIL